MKIGLTVEWLLGMLEYWSGGVLEEWNKNLFLEQIITVRFLLITIIYTLTKYFYFITFMSSNYLEHLDNLNTNRFSYR